MCHKKIRIPRENANEIMRAWGSMTNSIEFVDWTKDDVEAKKNYGSMLKRCEEMNTKITDLETICTEFHQPGIKYDQYWTFSHDLAEDIKKRDKAYGSIYFDLIEGEVLDNDKKIKELVQSHGQIREDLISLIEKQHVWLKTSELVVTNSQFNSDFGNVDADVKGVKQSPTNLSFIAGVISTADELKMKRMIFRVSRGRALTTFYELLINKEEYCLMTSIRQRGFSFANNEPKEKQEENLDINKSWAEKLSNIKPLDEGYNTCKKKIFNIIFQGGEGNVWLGKILKVCEIFQAHRYSVPKSTEINKKISEYKKEIEDKKVWLIRLEMNIKDILNKSIAFKDKNFSKYSLYKLYFLQEKMIYLTLNKCIVRDNFIDGEVWIPKRNWDSIMNVLQNVFRDQDNKLTASLQDIPIDDDQMPPTYIPTNDFLWAFQEIVNTYGIPRYQEINPAYFAIVTFPFLFGVMFGDIAHGLIVMLFGLYWCFNNHNIEKTESMLKITLKGRYFLVWMGFFAFYCGWWYNDFLSVPIEFSTCYTNITGNEYMRASPDCVYKFGWDPKWYVAKNELAFINSLKMKLSVLIGVSHMTFGIILKGVNSWLIGDWAEFLFVFFPQLVLMLIWFGYMDALIIIKWLINWKQYDDISDQSRDNISTAPDIKSILMNIFLNPFKQIKHTLWGGADTQWHFHLFVLLIAVLCMVIMLLPKTIIDFQRAKKKYFIRRQEKNVNNLDAPFWEDEMENNMKDNKKVGEPEFSEFFVHHVIETIEFVLGTVSNTASYLRLWALSLAHSQLSKVFFKYFILDFAQSKNVIVGILMVSVVYFVYAAISLAVLLFMDLMECFLHTLRLHWVEFQGKFFKADGYMFKPFSFNQVITEREN